MRQRAAHREGGRLAVTCPCGATLVVDATTGTVLTHEVPARPIAAGKSFDALLAGVDDGKKKAAAAFDRGLSGLRDQERLLDAKFEAALRRADDTDDDEPPVMPWDLD